jgi:hypothetical protein
MVTHISGHKSSVLRGSKVLFECSDGSVVVSKFNKIYKASGNELEVICSLPIPWVLKILAYSKIIYRALRLGVRASVEYKGSYYFVFNSRIYRYDTYNGSLSVDFVFQGSRGPLSFLVLDGFPDFDDGLCFGEYLGNHKKNPVSVYFRKDKWVNVHTFNEGELNHIHSMVSDPYRNLVWLLAGDFGNSAAIYAFSNNFNGISRVVSGSQKYRACVAFPVPEGLLYATDTQIQKNSIRMLKKQGGEWRSDHLYDLNGPCIYGSDIKDYFVFSTSTEPGESAKNRLHALLDNKPGAGIVSNKSDIVCVSKKELSFFLVHSAKKDILPYRLFQFGAIIFPAGKINKNVIYAYQVGSISNDLNTVVINIGRL